MYRLKVMLEYASPLTEDSIATCLPSQIPCGFDPRPSSVHRQVINPLARRRGLVGV